MKKIGLIIAALALSVTPSTAFADPPQQPDDGQNGVNGALLAHCYNHIQKAPTGNLGECMSFWDASEQGFTSKFCDYLLETDQLEDYGFVSFSDCVRTLQ